jgi:hypothetical protein
MKHLAFLLAFTLAVPLAAADEQKTPPRTPQRTQSRAPSTPRPTGEPQLSAATALHAKISEVRFDNAPLRDCFDWLRDTLGTNLYVDWGALEALGVDPNKGVTINVRWVTVPSLLRLLLQETGQSELLTYYVSGNVLTVTTKEKADEQLFTRVYPIEDLMLRPRKITGSRMDMGDSGSRSGSSRSSSYSGSSRNSIFGERDRDYDDDEESEKARGQEVVDMVKQLTPAEIWEEAGGRAKITYFRGKLILTAPRSVHELIGGPIRD